MSEEECPKYKDGDIVWVKLGSCWWPGEVTENGPEDFSAKKPPLAIVKFFNEGTYEFVKSHNHIYFYNCERKHEFIKKGMDSFRANNSHMEKFPGDVSLAEIKTDGNPNILSDPIFIPQKKSSIIAEVFGSPSPKKTPKEGARPRGRASSGKNSTKKPAKVNITHRRFLGCDDYEAHIRVQYPGKDADQHSSDEEIQRLNAEPSKDFNCSSCSFHTHRIDVMLFHVRCHIKGIASPVQVKKKASPKKKKTRVKHITSDDDRTNSSSIIDTDSEEEAKPKPKRKKRAQGGAKKTKQKKVQVLEAEEEEEKPVTDIRTNLLAEWSDSDDNEETEMSKLDTSGEPENTTVVEEKKEETKQPPPPPPPEEPKDSNKSCFDFDDEEEDTSVVQTAVGRKIPRVIPPSDKRRSTEQDEDASLPTAEDDKNRVVILNVGESPIENANSVSDDVDVAKEEAVFKDLMDSTSVPDLPEVPETIKTTPNFPESKTIKIPDKKSEEVATKLTNPKKRFVKSFEDFELLLNEQRKAQEEKEEELRKEKDRDKTSAVEETPRDTEAKVTAEPVQEPAKIAEIAEEKPKTPQEKIEVEEEDKEPKIEEEPAKIEELKTNIPSEVEEEEEETKDNLDEKKVDGNLQISKLKCQVMSKLSDEEESPKTKSKSSHRTPRSKILESYRNDKHNEEQSKKTIEEEEEKEKKHAPKKSKILKYNQETEERNEEESSSREEAIIKEVEAIPEKNPDEEIGKVAQIDEYFKDFLFTFDKKSDTPKAQEETKPSSEEKTEEVVEEEKVEVKPTNELTIKCASNDENNEEGMDIAIKTNLTNFNKNDEEMSALSTLAMVSQQLDKPSSEEEEAVEAPAPIPTPPFENFSKKESELVPIDGNLTVVSEKDLADGQVEITANASPTYKKPVTLTNFSMDFSECNSNSTSDSLSSEKSSDLPTSKAEDIKERASEDMLDIEEQIPSQIVDKTKPGAEQSPAGATSKLLERLTTNEAKVKEQNATPKPAKVPLVKEMKSTKTKFVIKSGNRLIKGAATTPPPKPSKAMIISEKIIKPITTKSPGEMSGSVSVQKITSKRNLHDPDEIDTFIIQKGTKTTVEPDEELELSLNEELSSEVPAKKFKKASPAIDPKKLQITSGASMKKRGKAKILQQTIITPAGEIIQPSVTQAPPVVTTAADDNVFDINSMPIVLSDQILTPESIENMPIFLSDSVQSTPETVTTPVVTRSQPSIVKKTPATQTNQGHMRLLNKTISTPTLIATPADKSKMAAKTPKILGSVGSKIIKQNSFASSKHGKYVIVTQSPSTTTQSKYTVGKRQTLIKRASGDLISTTGTLQKVQNLATTPEPSGNKIMILTNQQGQQQRVLLTPAQQKMMGYQQQGTKVTKTLVKGNILQKAKESPVAGSSGLISKSLGSRIATNQTLISSSGHVLTPIHPHQSKTVRLEKSSLPQRKLQMQSQKVPAKPQKTILIKNQHGQTVRKIQGTDDALLDQQVAEQLEAIKATSGVLQQKQEILNYKSATATPPTKSFRRSYVKKVETPPTKPVPKPSPIAKAEAVPPLAPISPKKHEQHTEKVSTSQSETKQERPLNQLVIQDAMGNQTTITEGQILALPSETVDGQPQSYMLVTLDESGNLTPLNNEALLSLDPNLGLGGDLGNTVLQIDQSALKEEATSTQPENVTVATTSESTTKISEPQATPQPPVVEEAKVVEETPPPVVPPVENVQATESSSVMPSSVPGEPGQQLIVTGDPIAAQKFLESLTEGSTDLANILASAEGSSILIHADGQQILINTDSDNQMLLSVNTDNLNMAESSEGGGNPIFATQPSKNQDILAAALADTDVFQQEQNGAQSKGLQAQLSPNSALYPMNVGNVLETSLTLNSPIMTPLEVPSTNSKKISDESDILNQVPKNVDLPITITDPNISQTVSQQQVASLINVNELQSNLELSLPISDSGITVTSSEMSPSFVYSLPNLDGSVDMNQKPFNTSMPLLTEDVEDTSSTKEDKAEVKGESKSDKIPSEGSFLDESEGLCTLGGEMCSSLSEPPPDMFDLSAVLSSHQIKSKEEEKGDQSEMADEEAELKIDDKGGDESVSSESANPETASVTETSSPNTTNEDSCEIPLQPQIVTTLKEDGVEAVTTNKRGSSEEVENESKKCKFDD